MGFFPTDAIDQDEVGPNANGSFFKYVAADDKWILIPNADVYTEAEVDGLFTTHTGDDNAHHEVLESVVGDTTPQLGGPLDLNDKAMTAELTAGEAFTAGIIGYIKDDAKVWKTNASAEATCDTKIVMATETISADNAGTFLLLGVFTTTSLTAGAQYWVSDTVAGTFTTTKPSSTGDIIRYVGTALSTTKFFFEPSKDYIEHL